MTMFNKSLRNQRPAAEKLRASEISDISEIVNDSVSAGDSDIALYSIGTESFSAEKTASAIRLFDNVSKNLNGFAEKLKASTGRKISVAQESAAASAAVTVSPATIRTFATRSIKAPVALAGYDKETGSLTTVVDNTGLHDAFENRVYANENFDERDNRNAKVTSVAYNLNAAQQNEFGETFFPTVNMSNDMVGVAVSVRLISTIKDFTRNADASLADFRRRNIVRALIDHTILKNDSNKLVPQYSAQTQKWFSAAIGSFSTEVEGVTHTTGALTVNTEIGDLISLGYPEKTVHALNQGDTLDPSIAVAAVYLQLGTSKVRVRLAGYKRAQFIAAPEDDTRTQNLNMAARDIVLKGTALQFDSSALAGDLALLKTNEWTATLELNLTGNVSVSQGNVRVDGTHLKLAKLNDKDGNLVALDAGDGKALADLFTKDSIVGWDADARLSNLNRRQRGQIMDTTVYNQIWTVPLRSPVTYPRPVNAAEDTDAADLAVLISTTHARTSNEAVSTLFDTADRLGEYVAARGNDYDSIPPELFGVARLLVIPTFKKADVDLTTIVQNQASHEKEKDISAEILLQIKNVAYEMYRDSGFQAFVESGAAGVTGNPTVLIGTDPYTSRFIIQSGDTRTIGPDFGYKIVTTPDKRMEGNIAIAFGYPELAQGEINPAHFGNMLWAAETVLVLQMNRNGDAMKETTVQPRFRHIINVPVLGWIVLRGIPEIVARRVPRAFYQLDKDGNIMDPIKVGP